MTHSLLNGTPVIVMLIGSNHRVHNKLLHTKPQNINITSLLNMQAGHQMHGLAYSRYGSIALVSISCADGRSNMLQRHAVQLVSHPCKDKAATNWLTNAQL